MNAADGFAEQFRDGENDHAILEGVGAVADGDRVGDGEFCEIAGGQAFDGGRGQNGVGGGNINIFDAVFAEDFAGFGDGSGGGDHVIDDEDVFAGDVADDVLGFGEGAGASAFVDEAEFTVEHFGVDLGAFDVTDVGADEDAVGELEAAEPFAEDGAGIEMIDGDVEESLDLSGVEIDADDAVGPGAFEEAGDEFCGDGGSAGVLLVLTGVSKIGDDGGDAGGAGTAEGVDPDEQLHEVGVDGMTGGLDDVTVAAADVFLDADDEFAIGEPLGTAAAEGQLEVVADSLGEEGIGPAGEYFERFCVHLGH